MRSQSLLHRIHSLWNLCLNYFINIVSFTNKMNWQRNLWHNYATDITEEIGVFQECQQITPSVFRYKHQSLIQSNTWNIQSELIYGVLECGLPSRDPGRVRWSVCLVVWYSRKQVYGLGIGLLVLSWRLEVSYFLVRWFLFIK